MNAKYSKAKYSNIELYLPNGTLISQISERRALKFLKNGRATATYENENITAITLQFYPKIVSMDPFYLNKKKSICVCCGTEDKLTKHHCIPYRYRKHFPLCYKESMSHDILLLCVDCHNKYEVHSKEYDKELLKNYNIEYVPEKVYKAASALSKYGEQIPLERKTYLQRLIADFHGGDDYDIEELRNPIISRKNQYKMFVDANLLNIVDIVISWREHFIKYATPQYMPQYWSVYGRYRK